MDLNVKLPIQTEHELQTQIKYMFKERKQEWGRDEFQLTLLSSKTTDSSSESVNS